MADEGLFDIRVDSTQVERAMRKIGIECGNGKVPLTNFWHWWKVENLRAWDKVKAPGGTHRGSKWPAFKPQYTRQDGTEGPAWGGIPKVHGRGKVKGRKRPSGQRVTRESTQLQDVGFGGGLRAELADPIILNKERLRIGTGKTYAEHVSRHGRDTWLKWKLPVDNKKFRAFILRHWRSVLRKHRAQ